MAAPGRIPKPAGRRAGARSAGSLKDTYKVFEAERFPQPDLPDGREWPAETVQWWAVWGRSPLSQDFTESDWSFLLDTAALHAAYWGGDLKVAAELRNRVCKFGVTPEDRAKLRITFSMAEKAESDKGPREGEGQSAAPRRSGGLKALPDAG